MNRILRGILAFSLCSVTVTAFDSANWPVYGGDPGGSKYSPLKQIDRSNVATLVGVWRFSTGEPIEPLAGHRKPPGFEATPIVIDGVMYFGTPYGHVFALDAATGAKKWSYDAHIARDADYGDFANRGVSTWLDPTAKAGAPCQRRIYFASIDARLTALDAASGRPCADFGNRGEIDRETGKPLFPVEERPVPASDVPGERRLPRSRCRCCRSRGCASA